MESPQKRSASVTAAAVVAILSGLFLLLCCSAAILAVLLVKLPGNTTELPPFARSAMLAGQGFMICLSLFGVATGIGIIYLRKWARISILVWGSLSVFFGVIGIPFAFLIPFPQTPNTPDLSPAGMPLFRGILLVIYGMPLLIGIWWLILFNRKSVKAQFAGQGGSDDQSLPRKPTCPLPIAVLAWFYISLVLNLVLLPWLPPHAPLFLFGYVLPGNAGKILLIITTPAYVIVGIGLLKLKPWSYSLTIGLQLFWLASGIVTALNHSYVAVMDSYMKEVQASFHLPETQSPAFNFTQHFGWMIAGGLILAGLILGLLVYYRPRFLEEASRAATAS